MKGKKLEEVQAEYRDRIRGLCLTCQKAVSGYYGVWQEGGTCSKACEAVQAAKPKYPGYTEEDFLQRLSEKERH